MEAPDILKSPGTMFVMLLGLGLYLTRDMQNIGTCIYYPVAKSGFFMTNPVIFHFAWTSHPLINFLQSLIRFTFFTDLLPYLPYHYTIALKSKIRQNAVSYP